MVGTHVAESEAKNTKPVIGLVGGVGSGKSTVARMMRSLGGYVIDADAIAHQVLQSPDIRSQLVDTWGPGILNNGGLVSRSELAKRVFDDPAQRQRLEGLIHPPVREEREHRRRVAMGDPDVKFVVEDVPLLFEAGLDRGCDQVVFVDCPRELREKRVRECRGWGPEELDRREKNQWPLDKKRSAAHAIILNDGDEAQCFAQVRSLVERILAMTTG